MNVELSTIELNKKYQPDRYINKEDKVSKSNLEKNISSYKEGTYIKYSWNKGSINFVGNNSAGVVKIGDNKWMPFSSISGFVDGYKSMTEIELLRKMSERKTTNIGVKIIK